MPDTVRLWDPLVRLFHWSLAFAFFANYFVTEEGEGWHRWIGYYAVAWILIRTVWGFVANGAAAWSDCWPTPARLKAHVSALLRGSDIHRMGHSPLGALVMILMMTAMFALGVTGYMLEEVDFLWGEEWLEEVHEFIANGLAALVGLHLLAAAVESLKLRENLPLSMITGRRKPLPERDHAT